MPTRDGRAARWSGGPQFVSHELGPAMKGIALEDDASTAWSPQARGMLDTMRAEREPCLPERQLAELQQRRWFDVRAAQAAIRSGVKSGG